ncbi:septation ring formation regulator EzrA [Scytonema hofmannii PCC 7110]|uniref:Probable septum site-determining protein MinC n=1 Tax=Scytonema hofmannii PCC 7110 TaxID=128403 RepID=A0A139WVT6_9CYAN|nr:septum site-determining protein MinC [Scytonema hofmannii]KYC36542.1 septation ring formation regulator EzrA [Scytonema hofmannii PCC 7110]
MSTYSNAEENPIIPESEVNSVLVYLKSNSAEGNAEVISVSVSENSHSAVVKTASHFVTSEEDSHSVVVNVESNSVAADVEQNVAVPETESDSNLLGVESNVVPINAESKPAPLIIDLNELPSLENTVNPNIQVQLKSEKERLLLILPTESQVPSSEYNWTDIWQQMKLRLLACHRSFSPNTPVYLEAQDRLLDGRQLQELAESLGQYQVYLKSVSTSRRQTAIAAATSGYSVEQIQPPKTLRSEPKPTRLPLAEPLYLEKTVRSGEEVRHPGHIILLGDLNPGGIVIADGDILIWGRLRGITHAGANGNRECLIMALQMEPTQLRIADAVARAPEKSPTQYYPEVAYVTSEGIRIARSTDFSKILLSRLSQKKDEG